MKNSLITPRKDLKKVIIIIPTYNESQCISQTLDELETVFQKLKYYDMSILIYDSNSPDGTSEIVKSYQKKYSNIHLICEPYKTGLGSAYIKALKYACTALHSDIVFEYDADGSHRPEYLPHMLNFFHQGADVVTGSRFVKGGKIPKEWQYHRKILSILGNRIARFFLSNRIKDYTTGYRGIRTQVLNRINLDTLLSKSYAYKIHLMWELYLSGAQIIEYPIHFVDRVNGQSKFPRDNAVESLKVVMRLRYLRIRKIFGQYLKN